MCIALRNRGRLYRRKKHRCVASSRYRGTIKDLGEILILELGHCQIVAVANHGFALLAFPTGRHNRHPQFNHINIERALPALRLHSITGGRVHESETPRGRSSRTTQLRKREEEVSRISRNLSRENSKPPSYPSSFFVPFCGYRFFASSRRWSAGNSAWPVLHGDCIRRIRVNNALRPELRKVRGETGKKGRSGRCLRALFARISIIIARLSRGERERERETDEGCANTSCGFTSIVPPKTNTLAVFRLFWGR